jgi:hypothetical protein
MSIGELEIGRWLWSTSDVDAKIKDQECGAGVNKKQGQPRNLYLPTLLPGTARSHKDRSFFYQARSDYPSAGKWKNCEAHGDPISTL